MKAPRYANAQAGTFAASYPVAAAVKCAVCFALIAQLAVMAAGARGHAAAVPAAARADARQVSAAVGDRPAAHRKQIFDERRARFEGGTPALLASDAVSRSGAARDAPRVPSRD